MSKAELLGLRVRQAEEETEKIRREWHTALITECPWKVGDLAKITRGGSNFYGNKYAPKYGRVRSISVRCDSVFVEFAPQTKNGFHARYEIHVWDSYDAVEKVDSVPPIGPLDAQ